MRGAVTSLVIGGLLVGGVAQAQHDHGHSHHDHAAHADRADAATTRGVSPYAGQETRAIKSLSTAERRGLEEGAGLGMAKPAELNSYPGPKHVIEHAEALGLTEDQRASARAAFEAMREKAVALGQRVVAKEAELEAAFRSGAADRETIRSLAREVGELRGELRFVHLEAHLAMREALTPEQVRRYDELRGYATAADE